MNWLDGIIIIALAYGLIRGLFKGFFKEVFQLLGIVLAAIIAFHYFKALGSYLVSLFNWPAMVANGIGFLLISFIVAGICYLLGLFLRRTTRFLAIRWLDMIGGAGFGVLKLALIMSIILNASLFLSSPLPSMEERLKDKFDKTLMARPIMDLAPAFYHLVVRVIPIKKRFEYQKFFPKKNQEAIVRNKIKGMLREKLDKEAIEGLMRKGISGEKMGEIKEALKKSIDEIETGELKERLKAEIEKIKIDQILRELAKEE
ncbi:CvpA family protein [bacterium]|nr:CvpA family protein [bacterium]